MRERLTHAFRAVHQRGEIHITARSLRAALVYIFFGTNDCQDLHDDPNLRPPLYYDRAFAYDSAFRQGDLLAELSRLDPALETHPILDRYLLRQAHDGFAADTPHNDRPALSSLRRRAYFAWSEQQISAASGGDKHAVGLARARHLAAFLLVGTGTDADRARICRQLCRGIARLEDVPPAAFAEGASVPLKITLRTPTETAFWVSKSVSRFTLTPYLTPTVEGIETLHTHVILAYQYDMGHTERLMISADLFNALMELSEGYQISDAQSDDTFANLSIFKQRLAQEGDRVLFAWNPAQEVVMRIEAKMMNGTQKLVIARFDTM